MAATMKSRAKARSDQKPVDWLAVTYDELRQLLAGIEGIPEKAIDPITTAAFLCAPMPGPVRAAWKVAETSVKGLIAALLDTGFWPDDARILGELQLRFQRGRFFRILPFSGPAVTKFGFDGPDGSIDKFVHVEPVESNGVSLERVRTSGGKREHFQDFVAIGMRVLEEAGCPRESQDRRGKALKTQSKAGKSSLDIMWEVVNLAWSDSPKTGHRRSGDAVRKAYGRGLGELRKDIVGDPGKHGGPGTSLIELLEEHRRKRGARGLGSIWLRR